MLRITPSHSAEGAARYYDAALGRSDYYGQQERGLWAGKGAEMLELRGQVSREQFVALANNQRPDCKGRLTARTNGTGRKYPACVRSQDANLGRKGNRGIQSAFGYACGPGHFFHTADSVFYVFRFQKHARESTARRIARLKTRLELYSYAANRRCARSQTQHNYRLANLFRHSHRPARRRRHGPRRRRLRPGQKRP